MGKDAAAEGDQGVAAVAVAAEAFLRSQTELIDLQVDRLRKAPASQPKWTMSALVERLHLVQQLLTIAFGLLVAVGLGAMTWHASQARGIVIEAFHATPELTQRGFTDAVLAAKLRDQLVYIHNKTITPQTGVDVRDDRAADVKIEIFKTGVSVGEAYQYLERLLGSETHVSGQLIPLQGTPAGGLELVGSVGGQRYRLTNKEGDIDRLIAESAENIYRSVEPLRFATWLDQNGLSSGALSLTRQLARATDRRDRARALAAKVNFSGVQLKTDEAIQVLRKVVELDPSLTNAWNDLGVREAELGHPAVAFQSFERSRNTARRARALTRQGQNYYRGIAQANADRIHGDFWGVIKLDCEQTEIMPCTHEALTEDNKSRPQVSKVDGGEAMKWASIARDLVQLHDPAKAEAMFPSEQKQDDLRSASFHARVAAGWLVAKTRLALERQDWDGVLQEAQAWDELSKDWPGLAYPTAPPMLRGYALAKLGRQAEAKAAIETTPLDCYPCLVQRGEIAAVMHDWPKVQYWFGKAATAAPSSPFVYASWGSALVAKGDVDDAIQNFRQGVKRGPRFADLWEGWGEALINKRDLAGAVEKFAQADKYAPRWGHNHLMWGQALAGLGKAAGAKVQYAVAASLELNSPDRVILNARLAGH